MKKIENERVKYEFIFIPDPLNPKTLCGNCKAILNPTGRSNGFHPKYCLNCGGEVDWSKRDEIEIY